MGHSREDPLGAGPLHAHGGGHPVRHLEIRPDVPATEKVGVLLQQLLGQRPPFFVDAHALGGADAVACQKDHHHPHPEQLPELLDQRLGLLGGDALDLRQPGGVLFQDLQGLVPEDVHDPPGQPRPDALHRPRGQVLPDRRGGLRQAPFKQRHLELVPEFRVGGVLPRQDQRLPRHHPLQRPHRREILLPGVDLHHREPRGSVLVKDLLHRPPDLNHFPLRHRFPSLSQQPASPESAFPHPGRRRFTDSSHQLSPQALRSFPPKPEQSRFSRRFARTGCWTRPCSKTVPCSCR